MNLLAGRGDKCQSTNRREDVAVPLGFRRAYPAWKSEADWPEGPALFQPRNFSFFSGPGHFTGRVIGQPARRQDGKQRDRAEHQEGNLQSAQSRLFIDPHRLARLGGRRRGACQSLRQALVAEEIDAFQIDLIAQLRGDDRVCIQPVDHRGAQHAHHQRPHQGRAHRGGEIAGRTPQRADIARQFLRGGGDQHVEEQRHQRPRADAEEDETQQHGNGAPVVADDVRQPERARRHDRERARGDPARGEAVVQAHHQDGGEEDRQFQRHHRDRGLERIATLHDLDVERDGEIRGRFHCADQEHGDQTRTAQRGPQ